MFAFEVEYLLGRAFAGDFMNRAETEWPPHPSRLFSALAAAYFENGATELEKHALEWLEAQAPPHIHAGEPGRGEAPMAFVPTNYPGDGPPVSRGKQPRFFPAQGPSESTVHFIWPESQPQDGVAKALDALASRTAYLGKACSVVRMRVADAPPASNYAPDPCGDLVLRVPSPGRLAELECLFRADQRVSAGAQQLYRKCGAPTEIQEAHSAFGYMAVVRKKRGLGLPIEASLTLTDAVRAALMSIAGKSGVVSEAIHGHMDGLHCAIAALPFVGRQHADGHLLGFAVVLPRTASLADRRQVLWACSQIAGRGLHIPGVADWELEEVEAAAALQGLRPATWSQSSRVWETVTPILLDRFPKKKGPNVEEILAESCIRIGLPKPIDMVHGPYSSLEGVPPVSAFRLRRKPEERPRWGVHAKLTFAQAVRGPVLLGAGRYFGLGLMRPQWKETANGR